MNFKNNIAELKDEMVSSTQKILKIKSVEDKGTPGAPFGDGVRKSLDCALEISKNLGFKTVDLDGYVGYAEFGEGEDYVGVLGHLDVVPEGDGWKYPPYGAEIHDGKIYARGSIDDKGPIMAALYGLKAIERSGAKLSKKVRIIFGTNEETGCKEMEYYLEKEKAPVSGFTPDAEYPLIYAEKGLTIFDLVKESKVKQSGNAIIKSIKGGQRPNMVPDYCEAVIDVKDMALLKNRINEYASSHKIDLKAEESNGQLVVKSVGVSAHGSVPQTGTNAIIQLFEVIKAMKFEKSDIIDFIEFMADNYDPYGEKLGAGLEDKASGKLSSNAGVITADENSIRFTMNLRYPVTFKLDDMMNPLNKRLEGTGIKIENFEHQGPLYFPEDHPLIATLLGVYEEETGSKGKPLAIGGGTYAKEMPNIVAFGPTFEGQPDICHIANEYISVDDLVKNAEIYAKAIYELAK